MAFAYPSFEEIMSQEGEELFRVNRALRSIMSRMLWVFVTTILVIAAVYFLSNEHGPLVWWFAPRWLAIIPALLLMEVFRKYNDDLYVFARHGVIHYQGRLSLKSSTPELKYIDILGMSVEQNLLGRILDYGDVLLDTAAESGVELTMHGVRSPTELSKLIERLLRNSIDEGGVSND